MTVATPTAPRLSPNRLVRCPHGHPHRAYFALCPVCEQLQRRWQQASDLAVLSIPGRKDRRRVRGDRRKGDVGRSVREAMGRSQEAVRGRVLGDSNGELCVVSAGGLWCSRLLQADRQCRAGGEV